jgi:hypothetical protein
MPNQTFKLIVVKVIIAKTYYSVAYRIEVVKGAEEASDRFENLTTSQKRIIDNCLKTLNPNTPNPFI